MYLMYRYEDVKYRTQAEVRAPYGQVAQLIEELAGAGEGALGIKLDAQLVDRLCAYARSVAAFPTAIKEV